MPLLSDFKKIIIINLLIISFIGKLTNNDLNIIENITPILIIYIFNFDILKPKSLNFSSLLIPVLVIYLIFVIIKRDRIMGIGPFWEAKKTLYIENNKDNYFYKFKLPLRLIEVEKELQNSKSKIVEPVFFGPRIDHAYVDLNFKVIKGIPLWWEGISINSKYTQLFKISNFNTMCFLNQTPNNGFNENIKIFILKNYTIDSSFKNIVFYKLK